MLLAYERKYWSRGIMRIAGVDEAGRGPLAGPVVAAAVIFPPHVAIDGVNDSKQLTEKKREQLYDQILSRAASVGIGIVGHEEIDRINILQASIMAMNQAIVQLSPEPEQLLVDGNFFRHLLHPVENIVKGDARSHSIAAASIIAKVTRDRMMTELDALYPQYSFARHKGYGTRAHIEAILKHGYCPVHRRSFHVGKLEGLVPEIDEPVSQGDASLHAAAGPVLAAAEALKRES